MKYERSGYTKLKTLNFKPRTIIMNIKAILRAFVSLWLILIPELLISQSPQWATVEHAVEVSPRVSIDQAKNDLLLLAREQAVAKVTGHRIQETTLLFQTEIGGEESKWYESYQRMVRQHVYGKITQEGKPEYDVRMTNGKIKLHIEYSAEVTPEIGLPDPGFTVDFKVDRSVYQVGDPITMEVEPSRDAYITIFSILADGTAAVIFPNRYMPDNKIRTGQNRIIPNNIEREVLRFVALEREDESPPYSEILLCVAVKKPIQFTAAEPTLKYNTHFTEINRWIMGIDISERVETIVNYSIIK